MFEEPVQGPESEGTIYRERITQEKAGIQNLVMLAIKAAGDNRGAASTILEVTRSTIVIESAWSCSF